MYLFLKYVLYCLFLVLEGEKETLISSRKASILSWMRLDGAQPYRWPHSGARPSEAVCHLLFSSVWPNKRATKGRKGWLYLSYRGVSVPHGKEDTAEFPVASMMQEHVVEACSHMRYDAWKGTMWGRGRYNPQRPNLRATSTTQTPHPWGSDAHTGDHRFKAKQKFGRYVSNPCCDVPSAWHFIWCLSSCPYKIELPHFVFVKQSTATWVA